MLNKVLTVLFLVVVIQPLQNAPPVVKIMSPQKSSSIKWGVPVRFSISVSDKEDGETKFGEIAANEVLVEARFVKDTSRALQVKSDNTPLLAMMQSNCMNCHAFESKLIGPSFLDISKKYQGNPSVDLLVKRVREGSSGIWGDIIMPTHHELSVEQTDKMVRWILNYAKDSNVKYQVGTEGAFKLDKPENADQVSGVVLTAIYVDHDKARGEDKVVLSVEK